MSLYPGNPRKEGDKYLLDDKALKDDKALQNSMAAAIEKAMENTYLEVKGSKLPAVGREDLRMLFLAIARGVLTYLDQHEGAMGAISGSGASAHTHKVRLNVTKKSHTKHG